MFVNLDAAMSDGPRLSALSFRRWAAGMAEQGITEAAAQEHFAAWAEQDRYFPLDEELAALRQAGFAEVECFWRRCLVGDLLRARAAQRLKPPDTSMFSPVTHPKSSESSAAMTLPTSSASPRRPSAVRSTSGGMTSG